MTTSVLDDADPHVDPRVQPTNAVSIAGRDRVGMLVDRGHQLRARRRRADGRDRKPAFAFPGRCPGGRWNDSTVFSQVTSGPNGLAAPDGVGVTITRDPLDGEDGQPDVANPYTYVHNDPLNLTDPTGMRAHDDDINNLDICVKIGLCKGPPSVDSLPECASSAWFLLNQPPPPPAADPLISILFPNAPTCRPKPQAVKLRPVSPPSLPAADGTPCDPPTTARGEKIVWNSSERQCGVWNVTYSLCRRNGDPGCTDRAIDVPKCPALISTPASALSYNSFGLAFGQLLEGDRQQALETFANGSSTSGGGYITGRFVGGSRFTGSTAAKFVGKIASLPASFFAGVVDLYCMTAEN